MRKLSVNVDHIATLREARKETFPDPVQAAVLAELGGASGITVHLRTDQRHIKERDLRLLRETIKTELNLEMALTKEMVKIANNIKPDIITLVPERPDEITTEGGLALKKLSPEKINPLVEMVKKAKRTLSVFIEPEKETVQLAKELGAHMIEINTNRYTKEPKNRFALLAEISETARFAKSIGLRVHCGHGLDYENIKEILKIKEIEGFSIGFAIIARAVFVGLKEAVSEMVRIIEAY